MRKIFISLTVALIVGIASYTLSLPSLAIPNLGHPASEIGGTSDAERTLTLSSTGKCAFLGDLEIRGNTYTGDLIVSQGKGITLGGVRRTTWPSGGGGATKLSQLIIDVDKDWNGKSITNLGNVGIGTTNPNAKLQVHGAISRQGTNLHGDADTIATHVNLGVDSTTGFRGKTRPYTTVGGGYSNTASRDYATVGGGAFNTASGVFDTVGGGSSNTASAHWATVGGGRGTSPLVTTPGQVEDICNLQILLIELLFEGIQTQQFQ